MSEPGGPLETKRVEAAKQAGWGEVMGYPLAAVAALVGAGVGAVVVKWAWEANMYAMPAVGIVAGWATSFASKKASWWIGAIAGVMALIVGTYAEWKFFSRYPALEDFIMHPQDLTKFTLLLHGVSVGVAVWLGSRK